MADEEHGETGESTAPDAETAGAEDEPRADTEPSATEDGPVQAAVPENVGEDEEKQKHEEQTVLAEKEVPPETVDEQQTDAVVAEESGNAQPEYESGGVPLEETAFIPEGQLESGEVPLKETGTTEGEPESGGVPLEEAAVTPEGQLESGEEEETGTPEGEPESGRVPLEETGAPEGEPETDGVPLEETAVTPGQLESGEVPLKETGTPKGEPESGGLPLEETGATEGDIEQQPDSTAADVVIPAVTDEEPVAVESVEPQEETVSLTDEGLLEVVHDGDGDSEDEDMEVDDLPQSAEQLADEPSEVAAYPSADDIDVIQPEPELDELAEFAEGDEPDATRATERVGRVEECPEVSSPPALLLEGRDDIETPKDESKIPSVLVCFFLYNFYSMFYRIVLQYIIVGNSNVIDSYRVMAKRHESYANEVKSATVVG